jgi:hypothetical protein
MVMVIAGLAVVEGVLRAILGPPPHQQVQRVLDDRRDGFTVRGDRVEPDWQRIDSTSFPAHRTRPRLAAFGGSAVHRGSTGVRDSEEFPVLAANRAGMDCVNLGWPGLDSYDVVVQADTLPAWPFDAWIVYLGHNDFGNPRFMAATGTPLTATVAEVRSRLLDLQLIFQLDRTVDSFRGQRDYVIPPLSEEAWSAALSGLTANMEHIAATAERAGVPLLLITPVSPVTRRPDDQPCPARPCPSDLFQAGMALRGSDPVRGADLLRRARDADRVGLRAPTAAQEAVRRTASAHPGVILIDAERDLPREEGLDVPSGTLFQDGVHFSGRGHRALADLLVPALRNRIPRRPPLDRAGPDVSP